MIRSKVILVKDLSGLLLRFPELVRAMELKDPAFIKYLFQWMDHAEQVLKQHRITAVSELAGIRSHIVAPTFESDTREPLRKRQTRVAATQMFALQSCISRCLEPEQEKLTGSREMIRQLLAMLADSKALQFASGNDVDGFVRQVWGIFSQHDQLRAHAVQLKSQLSEQDILLLIMEEIDLEQFSSPTPLAPHS